MKLTANERRAIALMAEYEGRCRREQPHNWYAGWSAVSSEATAVLDGQPWLHGNTVLALERKGLVVCEWDREASSVRLSEAGRAVASGRDMDGNTTEATAA